MTASARSVESPVTRRVAAISALAAFAIVALAGSALAGHGIAITAPTEGAQVPYGSAFSFTSASTSGVCTPGDVTWTFGDGGTATGATASRTFAAEAVGSTVTASVSQAFTGTTNHCTNAPTRSAGPVTFSVVDTTAPTIDEPSDVLAEATSADGAAVSFSAPASHDEVDGDGTSVCDATSGATFPLGVTTVTCTASDAAGNAAEAVALTVTVQDTTGPVIDPVDDITVEADSADGAAVDYGLVMSEDAVDGSQAASCSPMQGSLFPIGASVVTCSRTDTHGNAAADVAFEVAVVDTTAPAFGPVADLIVETASPSGEAVAFDVTASDTVDGDVAAECAPASGSVFPIGETTVECTATDAAGNTAAVSFLVTVVRSAEFPLDVTVATDKARYNAVEALTDGVGGTVTVSYLGNGRLEGAAITLRVSNNGVVNNLMRTEISGVTDANGEFRFELPQEFTLPGIYGVTATVTYAAATKTVGTSYMVLV